MNAIDVNGVEFTYPDGTEAVNDVSFTVSNGEFFGFLGPNGASKTTTIKMLVTLLHPTRGDISVNGFALTEEPVAIRNSIGYNAQETGVWDDLTARENIQIACEAYHVPKDERAERIDDLLRLADLEDAADNRGRTFSGGMQRRLDIATSLVHQPPLVFLDEPTTGHDPEARLRLWEYFREINARGTTIFLTTQNLEEADQLCSRIAVIADGEIVASGSPAALKTQAGEDSLDITFENASPADRERAVLCDTYKYEYNPMTTNDTRQDGTLSEQIIETVASWPAITADDGRFNATSFKLAGGRSVAGMPGEIGHLHPRLADIGYPTSLRDQLIADGHTEEHHALPRHPNATTFHIESADDIDHVVWLFRLSYLVHVTVLQQHGETEPELTDIDVRDELDELAPSDAIRHAFETIEGDDS